MECGPIPRFVILLEKDKGRWLKRDGAFRLMDIHEDAFIEQSKQILDPEKIEELY